MKVAFATTDGINVDEHFGRAGIFSVYELTPEDYRFVELRKFADGLESGSGNERHGRFARRPGAVKS